MVGPFGPRKMLKPNDERTPSKENILSNDESLARMVQQEEQVAADVKLVRNLLQQEFWQEETTCHDRGGCN